MGQEIDAEHFNRQDFHRFEQFIKLELEQLNAWYRDGNWSAAQSIGGLELETWLVSPDGHPLPINERVLKNANSKDIVPELSKFNVEFNVTPQRLGGRGIQRLAEELEAQWKRCEEAANQVQATVVSIGILPTVTETQLSLENISDLNRYRALNEQVMRMREGRPIRLDIVGREQLHVEHRDVVLESGTTSLQLHLQVPVQRSVRALNAAIVLSAPLVAIAANSPILFGKILWEESRIPLFEQTVAVGQPEFARVTFGSGYARESLAEFFVENHEHYAIMLPLVQEEHSQRLVHLRLQNGTIWRWNRPLIGFDEDGTPHLRVEQRVMAAGPTTLDMAANMGFYYGLGEYYATVSTPPELQLNFERARANFYAAARFGIDATIHWLDGQELKLSELILNELIDNARRGLEQLAVDADLIDRWLSIIEARASTGKTGSAWQRAFAREHDRDFALLTREYRTRQRSGEPVHTWTI